MAAIRTFEFEILGSLFTRDKGLATDFALVLAFSAIIVIKVMMRSATNRTGNIFRDGLTVTTLDRLELFAEFLLIVGDENLPVLLNERNNCW